MWRSLKYTVWGGGGGEMNVAQLRPFLSRFLGPKVPQLSRFDILGHFFLSMNSTFSLPQCCNIGSHGSNLDVL